MAQARGLHAARADNGGPRRENSSVTIMRAFVMYRTRLDRRREEDVMERRMLLGARTDAASLSVPLEGSSAQVAGAQNPTEAGASVARQGVFATVQAAVAGNTIFVRRYGQEAAPFHVVTSSEKEWTVFPGNAEQWQAEEGRALDEWRARGRAIANPLIRVRIKGLGRIGTEYREKRRFRDSVVSSTSTGSPRLVVRTT